MILLLAACAPDAVVTVDGADAFGAVKSAFFTGRVLTELWVWDGAGLTDVGAATLNPAVRVYDRKVGCDGYDGELAAWADASADLLGASADGTDIPAFCEAVPDFFDAVAAGERPAAGAYLGIEWCVGGECEGTPSEGEHRVGDDGDAWFGVGLSMWDEGFESGRAARARDAWSVDTCTFSDEYLASEPGRSAVWTSVDGTVTLDAVSADHLSGSASAELRDPATGDEATAVQVEATFDVDYCQLSEADRLVAI